MGWVKQQKDEHRCKKPTNANGVAVGDEWQCDKCEVIWTVTTIIPSGRGGYLDNWYAAALLWRKDPEGPVAS